MPGTAESCTPGWVHGLTREEQGQHRAAALQVAVHKMHWSLLWVGTGLCCHNVVTLSPDNSSSDGVPPLEQPSGQCWAPDSQSVVCNMNQSVTPLSQSIFYK